MVGSIEEEVGFQVEVKQFYSMVLADKDPIILPTRHEVDSRFGDWFVQYPISKQAYVTVFVVTHDESNDLAAAEQLLKT